MLTRLLHFISGNNTPDIEKRLFTTVVFISLLVALVGSLVNFHLKMHWLLYFIVGLGSVMLLWIFILARFYKRYLIWEFIAAALVIISGSWLYNQGPEGSINYIFILGLITFLSVTKRKHHGLVVAIVFTNIAFLHFINYYAPSWVHPYESEQVKLSDLIFTFAYFLLFITLIFSSLRFNYEAERSQVALQNEQIERQLKRINESISYAEYIQKAIIQREDALQPFFKKHYIFWLSKFNIGGDFYIVIPHPLDRNLQYVIIADCTGHGVPGALLTSLGISYFNEVILHNLSLPTHEILNEVREKFKNQLSVGDKINDYTDGMDVAICLIDQAKKTLEYSGSNRPLYLIRDKELIEYKPDRMPIGSHHNDYRSFTSVIVQLHDNDNIILSTDGYADQYGEIEQRKFYVARFKKLLIEISTEPFELQKSILIKTFNEWRKNEEQTDDILVFSFIPILD